MCEIEYNAKEWKLVGNNLMVHIPLQISYEIHVWEDTLAARAIHVGGPDEVLEDDVEYLSKFAVRAYWEAIGFGREVMTMRGPEPN